MAKLGSVVAALVLGASSSASAATVFQIQFDDAMGASPPGTVTTPIVGAGTFISPIDLGVGLYELSTLTGFSLDIGFGDEIFSASDIATPLADVGVLISQDGSDERLVFTEFGASGDDGPFGGSLDMENINTDELSFEPTYAPGGSAHDQYQEVGGGVNTNNDSGNYLALGISGAPEPSAWAMMLLGSGGLGAALRRRRHKAVAAVA
jgi:hypothetical protein